MSTATVHAMFLWAGFMERGELYDEGQIEVAQGIAKWAHAIEAAMHDLWARKDFAGVFDYEVTEAFGEYLRKHRDYSDRRLAFVLLCLIDVFFSQGESRLTVDEMVRTHETILAVIEQ